MRYPQLVPEAVCTTPCEVVIYSPDIDSNGAPVIAYSGSLRCNYQERSLRSLSDKKVQIQNIGDAFFCGDPFPDIPISAGTIKVYGVTHEIKSGTKARNLDGSVNFTRLEVI